MVLVILASPRTAMSVLTPQQPPRSDDRTDVEALEALIEEARRRARRRRRWYAFCTLVAAAAALLGYFGFDHGGGGTGSQARAERPSGGAGARSQGDGASPALGLSLDGADVISALVVDPQRPRTIFAATYGGVLKSSDGGRSWWAVNAAPTAIRVDSFVIDPQDPEILYVGTGGGVFKSTDGGASWHATNAGLFGDETAEERNHRLVEGYVGALAVDPRDPQTVYAAAWANGLFKSTNGGASWRRVGPRDVGTVVLDPENPETIYAGAVAAPRRPGEGFRRRPLDGVLKSSDGGSSWRAVGLQGKNVAWLALHPEDANIVYAGASEHDVFNERRVFKSSDGGSSWRAAALPGKDVDVLTFDPRDPDTVYANVSDGTVFGRIIKSTDGARSWRALDVGQGANFLALHPRNSAMLYALSDTGLLVSSDAGRSWRGLRGDPFWKALISTTP
jgi:photosystem II stability/assembly factor-like uncharacterized protein